MPKEQNGDSGERDALRQARAARIRMARAYADLDQAPIAKLLGVSVVTVKRMERGHREITLDELHAIADYCNVPHAFVEETGWDIYEVTTGSYPSHTNVATSDEVRELKGEFARLVDVLLAREDAQALAREALEQFRGS